MMGVWQSLKSKLKIRRPGATEPRQQPAGTQVLDSQVQYQNGYRESKPLEISGVEPPAVVNDTISQLTLWSRDYWSISTTHAHSDEQALLNVRMLTLLRWYYRYDLTYNCCVGSIQIRTFGTWLSNKTHNTPSWRNGSPNSDQPLQYPENQWRYL